jgi:hypothetical protein
LRQGAAGTSDFKPGGVSFSIFQMPPDWWIGHHGKTVLPEERVPGFQSVVFKVPQTYGRLKLTSEFSPQPLGS